MYCEGGKRREREFVMTLDEARERRQDMPQGGWTETADIHRVDLAGTVARICELALQPGARPHLRTGD
jgi:hypothetical protein